MREPCTCPCHEDPAVACDQCCEGPPKSAPAAVLLVSGGEKARLTIKAGLIGQSAQILLGDHDITRACKAINLEMCVGKVNRAIVEFFPSAVDVEVEVETESPPAPLSMDAAQDLIREDFRLRNWVEISGLYGITVQEAERRWDADPEFRRDATLRCALEIVKADDAKRLAIESRRR